MFSLSWVLDREGTGSVYWRPWKKRGKIVGREGGSLMPTLTQPRDIFSNIAQKDYLSLFAGKRPKHDAVMDLLHFKKVDVAKATEVPLNSVRFDEKMPSD